MRVSAPVTSSLLFLFECAVPRVDSTPLVRVCGLYRSCSSVLTCEHHTHHAWCWAGRAGEGDSMGDGRSRSESRRGAEITCEMDAPPTPPAAREAAVKLKVKGAGVMTYCMYAADRAARCTSHSTFESFSLQMACAETRNAEGEMRNGNANGLYVQTFLTY